MSVRLSRCDPNLLDFVTWAILQGCRLFQRVHVKHEGLVVTERIPQYDFVAIVPVEAAQSVIDVVKDVSFPLRVSPENHGVEVPFWKDLSRGSFVFVAFLTKVLLTGQLRGIQSYLEILPFNPDLPIGRAAELSQATDGYREWTNALSVHCKASRSDFDIAFRRAYCLFRRHAIPFWTSNATWCAGHPYFKTLPFVKQGFGDIMGMLPVLDLAVHSPTPNSAIGYPDEEMLAWLSQQRTGVRQDRDYFVMQALRDIQKGEIVTVNKNAHFNFENDAFNAWFGFPNESQVVSEEKTVLNIPDKKT